MQKNILLLLLITSGATPHVSAAESWCPCLFTRVVPVLPTEEETTPAGPDAQRGAINTEETGPAGAGSGAGADKEDAKDAAAEEVAEAMESAPHRGHHAPTTLARDAHRKPIYIEFISGHEDTVYRLSQKVAQLRRSSIEGLNPKPAHIKQLRRMSAEATSERFKGMFIEASSTVFSPLLRNNLIRREHEIEMGAPNNTYRFFEFSYKRERHRGYTLALDYQEKKGSNKIYLIGFFNAEDAMDATSIFELSGNDSICKLTEEQMQKLDGRRMLNVSLNRLQNLNDDADNTQAHIIKDWLAKTGNCLKRITSPHTGKMYEWLCNQAEEPITTAGFIMLQTLRVV